jgi:dihydrofolate reductase
VTWPADGLSTLLSRSVISNAGTDLSAWANSSLLSGDLAEAIATHKTEHDVIVLGSVSVVHALAERDLVDECRIMIFCDLVGHGTKLFAADTVPAYLRLVSAETVGPAVLMHYERRPSNFDSLTIPSAVAPRR